MLKRVVIGLVLVAVGAGTAAIVFAAFIVPHQATGTINTAVSGVEELYICQPSGSTVSPQCPIDTAGADETIYAASEDLVPGSVEWQKLRVTNVGSEPWDILGMVPNWTETSDPSGLCNTIPEGVIFSGTQSGQTNSPTTQFGGATGPGVTVLGKVSGSVPRDPVENIGYGNFFNDNHPLVAGSTVFRLLDTNQGRTVHVEPGDYEDLLLGIRLPTSTPDDCLNVIWTLTTTWEVQAHTP